MKLAIVGVTGLVGSTMLKVLEEREFELDELLPVASQRSVGQEIQYQNKTYKVMTAQDAITQKPDIAIFSAGGTVSKELAPLFAEVGTTVIDNSSAWRMDASKKLIIPEINGHLLTAEDKIIANPNCSTIQMLVALAPLHQKYGIKRLVISTYQSVTGTGKKAVEQLLAEKDDATHEYEKAYPHQIYANILPHIDVFLDNDYTKEEMKMVHETHKILGDDSIGITATAVRVPVMGGHAESLNVELNKVYEIADIKKMLEATAGLIVQDEPNKNLYPLPIHAEGKDEVFVGRLRRDDSQPNTLNMWVVADNLRKGAATNTIQIAEYLLEKGLVSK